jgi:hypothetical protein
MGITSNIAASRRDVDSPDVLEGNARFENAYAK